MLSRDDNLRELDENQKDENRPIRFGLHAKVRFTRLLCCESRIKNRQGGSPDGWWCEVEA